MITDQSPSLTIAEIESEYDQQWVLVDAPMVDEAGAVLAGCVVAHGESPEAVLDQAALALSGEIAFFWVGAWPETNAVYVL
jgi:hypothetical protein